MVTSMRKKTTGGENSWRDSNTFTRWFLHLSTHHKTGLRQRFKQTMNREVILEMIYQQGEFVRNNGLIS